MPRALPAGAQCWSPFSPDSRALPSSSGRAFIAGAFGTGHRSPPAGRGAKHRSSGPDGSVSQEAGRADPGARRPDAAQGGQDCERPEKGDRVAEDAGEQISAAASRGSDGRLRLHVALMADFGGTGVSDCAVGQLRREIPLVRIHLAPPPSRTELTYFPRARNKPTFPRLGAWEFGLWPPVGGLSR